MCIFICVSVHPPPTPTHAFAPAGSAISRNSALRSFLFTGSFGEYSVLTVRFRYYCLLFSSMCLSWKQSRENTPLNFCWRIDCGQLPLLPFYRRENCVIIWGSFGSLSESGVLKNCLWFRYHHFILWHTFTFAVVSERLQTQAFIRDCRRSIICICIFIWPHLCQ